jgi:two-component system NtrC family response regulator
MTKILIVDSDKFFVELASSWLKCKSYDVTSAPSLSEGIKLLASFKPDVVIVAISVPETEPIGSLLKEYINSYVSFQVIITGYNLNSKKISKYLKDGAFDCFEKPMRLKGAFIEETKLQERVINTVNSAIISAKNAISIDENFKRENIIGNSRAIISCLAMLNKAAKTEQPILITGETGTGKQLIAQAAHNNSLRYKNKFVQLNSSALPKSTIEAELFGYTKGSHNMADKDKIGLIKQADGGTLFLDEIGNLSIPIQERFLKVVEEKEFYKVGGTVPEFSNVRLVSATNSDLEQKISEGTFRLDFYHRINAFCIHLPPLRDRREDIKDIAEYFIKQLSAESKRDFKLTQEFLDALELYRWDGNIRQLKNVINWSVAFAEENEVLNVDHLPPEIRKNWIANKGYKVHKPTKEDIAQSWEEMVFPTENDEGQNPHCRKYFEMDYETGVPLFYDTINTDTAQSVDPLMSISSNVETTPEDIITGRIKWQQIRKLTPYYKRVSIMVVAKSLWSHPQKDLAAKLGVESNTFERFFSTAKKKAKSKEFQIDDLKPFVSNQHHNALQRFFSKIQSSTSPNRLSNP